MSEAAAAEQEEREDEAQEAPALKRNTASHQLGVARKLHVSRKSVSLHAGFADSIAGGGATAGAGMSSRAERSRAPADVASEGFSGAAHDIPHRKDMEKSFGTSFAGVKAYSDGPARKANESLGAHAYAMGDQVAFSSANPDKATVAHELTHVLQHTGRGPARKAASNAGDGGIDTAGEGEADKVEAAVASGKPAKSVLDGDEQEGEEKEGEEKDKKDKDAKGEEKKKEQLAEAGDKATEKTAGDGDKKPAAPQLKKADRPALDSKFGMGMTFSAEGLEKSYQWELWKAPPIEIPIVAVPGLNFMVEPSVVVKAAGGVDWKAKSLKAAVGVEGGVGLGLSYGNSAVAAIYGIMEAKATGGFEYEKKDTGWNLAGSIGLSTNFKVGVKLAGGILDYGFEFGKCEIGKLTGLYWENGRFDRGKLGWEWGEKPKEFFAAIKAAIEKAKRLLSMAADAAAAVAARARQAASAVYNAGADAIRWVTSW